MAAPRDDFKAERSLITSADDAVPIVKDGNNFPGGVAKAIFVGTGGDVIGRTKGSGNTNRTFKNVPAGTELNVRFVSIDATSSANDLLAYY